MVWHVDFTTPGFREPLHLPRPAEIVERRPRSRAEQLRRDLAAVVRLFEQTDTLLDRIAADPGAIHRGGAVRYTDEEERR